MSEAELIIKDIIELCNEILEYEDPYSDGHLAQQILDLIDEHYEPVTVEEKEEDF